MTRYEGIPQGLRGDYAASQADFTVPQHHAGYTADDHATWRTLYARQSALLPAHAAAAFRDGLHHLDRGAGVPDLAAASRTLRGLTGRSRGCTGTWWSSR